MNGGTKKYDLMYSIDLNIVCYCQRDMPRGPRAFVKSWITMRRIINNNYMNGPSTIFYDFLPGPTGKMILKLNYGLEARQQMEESIRMNQTPVTFNHFHVTKLECEVNSKDSK